MESLCGKTVRWTFSDGPAAGMLFEHDLNEDGSIVWRALDGPWKGASSQEQRYAAMKISDDVYAVSYLSKSGNTLTVVLNLSTGRAFGFASGNNDWHPMTGTFEVVQ
ncbi:MAG TPA: MoaF N-terminal domain-containing protein [Vicinamibacterales bacterium]|nr:MoaF N-terminal domain-containing protein [Vicinamibacterales bacterium]